jgi:hypothetical protein
LNFSGNEDWLKGDVAYHFADVDGDGSADAIKDTISGVTVRPAYASLKTFGASKYWYSPGSGKSTYADMDNDGKKDRVVYNDKEILISKSSGSSFQAPQRWLGGQHRQYSGHEGHLLRGR